MTYTKLIKPDKTAVTDLEKDIDKAVIDIQRHESWANTLKLLHMCEAKEIVAGNEKAIVIYVPVPQLNSYHRIHKRLVGELEKKLSGTHVMICAFRRILPKPKRKSKCNPKQKRPRSRTLTEVHDNLLKDLVFPAEIVGKRIQMKTDGSALVKCHLDVAQRTEVEHKIRAITGIYKRLTGKNVVLEFPEHVF